MSENELKPGQVPPRPCPTCGKMLDGASSRDPMARPKDGDVTVCVYCGGWATFVGGGLRLERLRIEDAPPKMRADMEKYNKIIRRLRPERFN